MDEYLSEVKAASDFQSDRESWLQLMKSDEDFNFQVRQFMEQLVSKKYVYQWNWLGVPIIKMPEEVILIQETFYKYRPTAVIEIGVARGGGIALYHSLQQLLDIQPNVLGIDIKFFPHTINSLSQLLMDGLQLIESRSTSEAARKAIQNFVRGHERVMMILDGDHSHVNVLDELCMCDELLPSGSIVLCADTIVADIPQPAVKRNWNKEKNPKTALKEFLSTRKNWTQILDICDKVLLSESPNGWIIKA